MAIRFDAAGDRVHLTATLPAADDTGRTVCGWFRTRVDRDDFSTYWRLSSSGGTVQTCAANSDGLDINLFTLSGSLADTYANSVDEWVYVAVTDNGTTVTQYAIPLDGATVSQNDTVGTGAVDQICIGGRASGDATEWFNGNAAYVRVFADTLTEAEVEAESASTSAVLTAWADWPLVEDLDDDSGNARNLTVVSGEPAYEAGPNIEGTNADAAHASGTGDALTAAASIGVESGIGTGTGVAQQPTTTADAIAPDAGLSSGSGSAHQPVITVSGSSSTGSWRSLDSILKLARAEANSPHPENDECPNDGTNYLTGPDGQKYCPFDGFRPGGHTS